MPTDPVQASSAAIAAEQVLPPAQAKNRSEATGAPTPAQGQPDTDYAELSQAQQPAAQAQKQPAPAQYVLAYHIDGQTKQLYFQVVNPQSGQVISQVPPQDVLNDEAQISQYLQAQSAPSKTSAVKGKGD